jgi:hypothetical protein
MFTDGEWEQLGTLPRYFVVIGGGVLSANSVVAGGNID